MPDRSVLEMQNGFTPNTMDSVLALDLEIRKATIHFYIDKAYDVMWKEGLQIIQCWSKSEDVKLNKLIS